MRTFNVIDKVYVKSDNSTNHIFSRYTYTLIIFVLLSSFINILLGNKNMVFSLIKTIIISLVFTSIITYIINIFKKKYSYIKIYTEDNTIFISLILSLFGYNTNIYILLLSILISIIFKNILKDINNACVIYGIIILILYKYLNNIESLFTITNNYLLSYNELNSISILNYLFSIEYLSPVLSVLSFIYLFYKKGIKYNLIFSYLTTFIIVILLISIIHNKIWFTLYELLTSNILFISIFILSDYKISPTIAEGQVIYGLILGIITVILRFIIPDLAIILTIILGSLLINKYLDKISYKFKYNKKFYYHTIGIFLVIMIAFQVILKIYLQS